MPYKGSEADKATRKKYKKRIHAEFMAWKATLACSLCGETHPAIIDFHHHTPHPDNIKINALITNRRYNFARKEIEEKCIVLCANCHRKHHWEDRKKA